MASLMNSFSALGLAEGEENQASTSKRKNTLDHNAEPFQPRTNGEASTSGKKLHQPLFWLDLEMTGLEPAKHVILELACFLTSGDLRTKIQGPHLTIRHPEEVLNSMNDWSAEHHAASGLTQRSRDSTVSTSDAEDQVMRFLELHTVSRKSTVLREYVAHLAGNSVHVDRGFLEAHMPRLHEYLHWRLVDVSTISELARRWFPRERNRAPKKMNTHSAMEDILESFRELKYYRQAIFKQPDPQPRTQ